MLNTFLYFKSFVFGICIGSFLNVIVYRFPNNISIIKPRSFCPKCKTKITLKENIPLISWVIQRGKCKSCNEFIPFKYPLVEMITGFLFVVFRDSSPSFYNFDSNVLLNIIFSWLFLSLLICISLIDIDNFWIPQGLINFGFVLGILGLIFLSISNDDAFIDIYLILKGLSTSVISYGIFELLRYSAKFIFKKDAMGQGDSKLIAMIALWLGPLGTLLAVGISYIFAAIFCLIGMSINLIRFRQAIPFGPFLSLGGLLTWLLGNELIIEKFLLA
jgi:leader peptidase (prepilin peptidase)/N-methyltransferase